MFIAAMAGLGTTSVWALNSCRHRRQGGTPSVLAAHCSWLNAFDLFELFLCASLATLNFVAEAPGSGTVWSAAFLCLLASTAALRRTQKGAAFEPRSRPSALSRIAAAFLVASATLFIAFPVLKPWSGPPELFVRWHPFGLETELIWRGVFLSFALGMLMTAFDPRGRHRGFMVALVLSGYLHSAEMGLDNLRSASMGGMNGNPEHLYGDVPGWFAIASFSLLYLIFDRPRATESP